MTENATEATEDPGTADVPKDAPEGESIGYAVYDATIGQYVTGVTATRPSRADAAKAVPEGHDAKVIRV